MHYIDAVTGQRYPLDTPRWCADSGHYLNLGPSPVLKRGDIDRNTYSVWRYAAALLVNPRGAVSMGEGSPADKARRTELARRASCGSDRV